MPLEDWGSPHSDTFYCTFIDATEDAEVAILPPCAAPAVLHHPELHAVLLPVTDQCHGMVGQLERVEVEPVLEACMLVDTALIVEEVIVDLERHHQGATLHQA